MTRDRRMGRRQRAEEQRRERRTRHVFGYGLVVVVVLGLAGWLVARPLLGNRPIPRGDVRVVQADMGGFRPTVLSVQANTPFTIRLESLDTRFHRDGGGRHQFAIDELGIDIVAPPLGSREETFVVREPGTYSFYCSICCGGKANPSMWGRLIVEA